MLCPLCKTKLQTAERHGVEIDYCLQCRGVWLDRGELDKIIARAVAVYQPDGLPHSDFPQYDASKGNHLEHRYPQRQRANFLEDMFDFGN